MENMSWTLLAYLLTSVACGVVSLETPLYVPADLNCSTLWSYHNLLSAGGGGDGGLWDDAGDMCAITYRGAAVSTPDGRTTISYDITYQVHKEILSQILNTVLRVKERDSKQVGDPFIAPYLAGVYQRLGLEYSGLLCFPRLTLLWRRLVAIQQHHHQHQQPAAAAAASGSGDAGQDGSDAATAAVMAAAGAAPKGEEATAEEEDVAAPSSSTASLSSPPGGPASVSAEHHARPAAARVVPLDWHVQQLHRELVLEPWKPTSLRLMLGRAATYSEARVAAGVHGGACGGGGAAAAGSTAAAGGGFGVSGPWVPRHVSLLLGGGGGGLGAPMVGALGAAAGGGGGGGVCDAYGGPIGGGGGDGGGGRAGGVLDVLLFWGLWLACPTALVALEALQAASDSPWMALYICIIATCRTLAEWRTTATLVLAPGRTAAQRLYGMAMAHLASGAASALLTGLLNTWLPLLGHGAAAAVVWLHLLLLPAVMVAVMGMARMPMVARQLAGAGQQGADGGSNDPTLRRGGGGRDRRNPGGGGDGLDLAAMRRAIREAERTAGTAGTPGGGGGGRGGGGGGTSSAAAAAQVHWPPALDVPAWLDDWPNAPEAFRCPITQALMREPAQASSGVTYERPAIMQWLDHRRMDPVTHVPLKRHRLVPNLNLRHMIEAWVQDRVEARRRLAQRLREEVSTEAALATLAAVAATAAATAATATATAATATATAATPTSSGCDTDTRSPSPSPSSPPPPADAGVAEEEQLAGPDVPQQRLDHGSEQWHGLVGGGGQEMETDGDGDGSTVPEGPSGGDVARPWCLGPGAASATVPPHESQDGAQGGNELVGMRIEAVEALVLAAARSRNPYHRHYQHAGMPSSPSYGNASASAAAGTMAAAAVAAGATGSTGCQAGRCRGSPSGWAPNGGEGDGSDGGNGCGVTSTANCEKALGTATTTTATLRRDTTAANRRWAEGREDQENVYGGTGRGHGASRTSDVVQRRHLDGGSGGVGAGGASVQGCEATGEARGSGSVLGDSDSDRDCGGRGGGGRGGGGRGDGGRGDGGRGGGGGAAAVVQDSDWDLAWGRDEGDSSGAAATDGGSNWEDLYDSNGHNPHGRRQRRDHRRRHGSPLLATPSRSDSGGVGGADDGTTGTALVAAAAGMTRGERVGNGLGAGRGGTAVEYDAGSDAAGR